MKALIALLVCIPIALACPPSIPETLVLSVESADTDVVNSYSDEDGQTLNYFQFMLQYPERMAGKQLQIRRNHGNKTDVLWTDNLTSSEGKITLSGSQVIDALLDLGPTLQQHDQARLEIVIGEEQVRLYRLSYRPADIQNCPVFKPRVRWFMPTLIIILGIAVLGGIILYLKGRR